MKKMMKKKNKFIAEAMAACILVLLMMILLPAVMWQSDKYQAMDIITQQYNGTKKTYYHVTGLGMTRKIGEFEPDEIAVYKLEDMFQSDVVNGKIVNKVSDPDWENSDGTKAEDTDILNRILEQALKIEHAVFSVKILKDKEEYFVVCELNVNWQEPFELYHYKEEKDELEYVARFEGEDVVGVRL
jgi:hypothetical protein